MLLVRKGAHFLEYFLLGLLSNGVARGLTKSVVLRWLFTLGVCAVVPLADELLIQARVDGRMGQMSDVLLDWVGVAGGILTTTVAAAIYRMGWRACERSHGKQQ